jgi:hypothetical protein
LPSAAQKKCFRTEPGRKGGHSFYRLPHTFGHAEPSFKGHLTPDNMLIKTVTIFFPPLLRAKKTGRRQQ